jgi:hypothetical protein
MARESEPVVLELAMLPREQVGPFLLLGLEKSADRSQIERHWADRLKWARRAQVQRNQPGAYPVPLEDINWAREILNDLERRLKADVASLNTDISKRRLTRLCRQFGLRDGQPTRLWQPLDVEKDLSEYTPTVEIPSPDEVQAGITVPEFPEAAALRAVADLLRQMVTLSLDPWSIDLPDATDPCEFIPEEGSYE